MLPHPDFEALDVPTSMMLGDYQLDVLTAADVEIDFEAVTRSQSVLQGLFGPTWPDGLTYEENLIDLYWHHREFTAKRSYAWVIRDRSATYLGCAYLFPRIGGCGSCDAAYWMANSHERLSHLAAFGPRYETWLTALLPKSLLISFKSNAHL